MDKYLHEWCERLTKELEDMLNKVNHDGMNPDYLEIVDKLTHSLKSVKTIMAMEDYGRQSYEGRSYEGRSYDGDGGYSGRGEYSGRGRDSMGRYSRGYGENRYSYDDGREKMAEQIRHMMQNESDQRVKGILNNALSQLTTG